MASDSIGKLMIREAELSRDRKLMTEALLVNGGKNSFFASRKEKILIKQSISYEKALEMSKENKPRQTNCQVTWPFLLYTVHCLMQIKLWLCKRRFSYVTILNDDSLKALSFIELGNVYGLKKRNYYHFGIFLVDYV